jgi:dihydroorotate dehydrogenase electron transfer subunit
MKHELPINVKVQSVKPEAEGITTLFFDYALEAKPGQFVMLWLPRIDSKPVGVAYQTKDSFGVTVSAVGEWSKRMNQLKAGDSVGLFGPYGNGFTLQGQRIVLIGGGYGAASLILLAEEALQKGIQSTLIIGARTESLLLYRERIEQLNVESIFTTDDGSFGRQGYNTEALSEIIAKEQIDMVYACGPELMERSVAEICRDAKLESQISLERHMKCGFGVCGSCCVDSSGKRICVEGPVFSGTEALDLLEFGKYHRDCSAQKHSF